MADEIVVGVDGSAAALDAVRWAAEAVRRKVALRLVHATDITSGLDGGLPMPQSFFDELDRAGQEFLADAVRLTGEVPVSTETPFAPAVALLLERSRTARMLALGSSGRSGLTGMLAGSTAVSVAAHASCPVAVVRGRPATGGPVVVGVDGSPTSEEALSVAFDEAAWRAVPLIAVHAWSDAKVALPAPDPGWAEVERDQLRLLAERLAGRRERYPDVRVERVVVRDRPRDELLARSRDAQLVVVGSRGRGGFRGLLLGSTSQALIHQAECPVLVVRPR
ncbi:universal stress protein [Amycolatopsis viridis]|uniref:Nucleotide-binding universal stress UspA family protein n=1 Tax=Amycolatopsis viridis TaxID=185678 RepID=A0ABX0SSX0_9PSEU|nr:universal stress protein [Amycolatopsis viridis]NIH80056.1 nucleotide-binding universal stress UspA family protein [Amycolatopsis viridis]